MKNLEASKKKFGETDKFISNTAELLMLGVIWYKMKNKYNWEEIADIMQRNGHQYGVQGMRRVGNNWAATKISYYFKLYSTLGIDYPTPANLVKWEQEIKELQQERRERIDRQKAKQAARKSGNSI